MSLLKILRLRKEPKFIDEDLSVEEISAKLFEMDFDEARQYGAKLSPEKKRLLGNGVRGFFRSLDRQSDEIYRQYGKSLSQYYDLDPAHDPGC